MTISINQIEYNMPLMVDGQLYLVMEYQHVKPGKGAAFVRVKLRNIKTDAVLEKTFRSSDRLEDVHLDERRLQYLYRQGDEFVFMDLDTYEQIPVSVSVIGPALDFLLENIEVTGLFHDNEMIKIILPTFIETEITHTEPGIRGDSSRAGTKPATIATGKTIQVPLFVQQGDKVKIDTRTGEYVERIQS